MSLALLLGTELTVDVEDGHTVFGISAPGHYVERVESLGVTHVPVATLTRSWSLFSDARAFLELFRELRGLNLDVLHTHTPKAGVMGRIAGRLAGVPVVVNTCHGLWARPQDRWLKRVLVYGAEALAIRFSDFELFQNAEDAHTLRRFVKRDRWKVVGNGIDLERFAPDPQGRARVRAEWGIRDDQIVVGTIGRRVREKGLTEFAEAARRLGDHAVFVWVGPDDDTDQSGQSPHQDAIRFVGERSDMPAVYSALDIFALASYREGFSRASMEAAACGLPLVLSDIRGCREIGTDEEHVLLVEPQSADAFVAGIRRLLGDSALRERLGSAARSRALLEFDQRRVARDSLQAYSRVMHASGSHDSRPVTVLHVVPQDQNRGGQVYAGQLRDVLAGHPDQRHLVVTLFDAPEAAARADIKLRVQGGIMRRAGFDPRAAWRLREAIRRQDADVVIAHGGEALKYVVPAARQVPTFYYKIGLSAAEVARPMHRRLYRFLSSRVYGVVGVSHAVAHQVTDLFGVPASRISVVHNGRDPQRYHPVDVSDGPNHQARVLFVGALEPGKRPDLFLDTVAELRDRRLDFTAAIVGDGPLRPRLEDHAAKLQVELLGVRSDVPELLRRSTVLVMTSAEQTEGMPGVVIEAALSGVPVVSTPAAGVRDVVISGETGFVTLGHGPGEIADAITRLLTDPDLALKLGSAARDRARRQFTVEATAGKWTTLIDGVLTAAELKGNA